MVWFFALLRPRGLAGRDTNQSWDHNRSRCNVGRVSIEIHSSQDWLFRWLGALAIGKWEVREGDMDVQDIWHGRHSWKKYKNEQLTLCLHKAWNSMCWCPNIPKAWDGRHAHGGLSSADAQGWIHSNCRLVGEVRVDSWLSRMRVHSQLSRMGEGQGNWSGRGIGRRKVCICTIIYAGTSQLVHDVVFPALGLSSHRIVSVIGIVDRCNRCLPVCTKNDIIEVGQDFQWPLLVGRLSKQLDIILKVLLILNASLTTNRWKLVITRQKITSLLVSIYWSEWWPVGHRTNLQMYNTQRSCSLSWSWPPVFYPFLEDRHTAFWWGHLFCRTKHRPSITQMVSYKRTHFSCMAYLGQHLIFEETLSVHLVWVLEENRCKWRKLVVWVLWVPL